MEQKRKTSSDTRTESDETDDVPQGADTVVDDEEIDDLLDEIDGVLEDNAEEFVNSYRQKGGE